MSLLVGDVLHGFSGGYFGRDSYNCKRIEAVGTDWVVAREEDNGQAVFANAAPHILEPYKEEYSYCGHGGPRDDEW
jgi:hypothetical protein